MEVEYFEPTPKPEAGPNCEHDDWVSSVAAWGGQDLTLTPHPHSNPQCLDHTGTPPGLFVSGSYDGIVRPHPNPKRKP